MTGAAGLRLNRRVQGGALGGHPNVTSGSLQSPWERFRASHGLLVPPTTGQAHSDLQAHSGLPDRGQGQTEEGLTPALLGPLLPPPKKGSLPQVL